MATLVRLLAGDDAAPAIRVTPEGPVFTRGALRADVKAVSVALARAGVLRGDVVSLCFRNQVRLPRRVRVTALAATLLPRQRKRTARRPLLCLAAPSRDCHHRRRRRLATPPRPGLPPASDRVGDLLPRRHVARRHRRAAQRVVRCRRVRVRHRPNPPAPPPGTVVDISLTCPRRYDMLNISSKFLVVPTEGHALAEEVAAKVGVATLGEG